MVSFWNVHICGKLEKHSRFVGIHSLGKAGKWIGNVSEQTIQQWALTS